MASGFSLKINRLKGQEDYESWKFAVQAYFEVEGLWDSVCGEEKEQDEQKKLQLDRTAKARLILLVDELNYSHIRNETTAKGVWTQLKNAFDDAGLSRRVALLRTLIMTRLDDCENINDYVCRIISNAHKLRGAGMEINEEWVGTLLLAGLGSKYEPMIMAIENSGVKISADQIKVKLLQETGASSKNGESSMYSKYKKQAGYEKQAKFKNVSKTAIKIRNRRIVLNVDDWGISHVSAALQNQMVVNTKEINMEPEITRLACHVKMEHMMLMHGIWIRERLRI